MDNQSPIQTDDSPPPNRLSFDNKWLVGASLVLAATFLVLTRGDPTEPVASATTSPIVLPTVPVTTPPRAEPLDLLRPAFEWQATTGLEEASTVAGIVEFGDAYAIGGDTRNGPAVWFSRDGRDWGLVGTIPASAGQQVSSIGVFQDQLLVTTRPSVPPGVGPGGEVWASGDGIEWERLDLPPLHPDFPLVLPEEVRGFDDRVVISGRSSSEGPKLEDILQPEFVDLVEAGLLRLDTAPGEYRLSAPPGFILESFPEESVIPASQGEVSNLVSWMGTDPQELEVTIPEVLGQLGDGRLVGSGLSGLVISETGRDWSPIGPLTGVATGFAPWRDGALVLTEDQLHYWDPDEQTARPLLPPNLDPSPSNEFLDPLTGTWGIAIVRWVAPDLTEYRPSSVRAEVDGGELRFEANEVSYRRDGTTIWKDALESLPARLDASLDRLVVGPPPDAVAIDLEVLGRIAPLLNQVEYHVQLLHSVDSVSWRVTDLGGVVGTNDLGSVEVHGTEDFLLAVGMASSPPNLGEVETVRIGTRRDDRARS